MRKNGKRQRRGSGPVCGEPRALLCQAVSKRESACGWRVTSCLWLLMKEVLFLLVARHPRALALLCSLDGLLSAELQTCVFLDKEETSVSTVCYVQRRISF